MTRPMHALCHRAKNMGQGVCHMFTLITLPQGCRDKCSQITQFFLKTQE